MSMKTKKKSAKKKQSSMAAVKPGKLFSQARRFQQEGRIEEAISSYRKALLLKPLYAEAWNDLAILYKRIGRLEEAISCYLKAIRIQPKTALLHYNYANALKANGAVDQALNAYRKAISLAPDEPLLWQEFASSLGGVSVNLLDSGVVDDLTQCLSMRGINKEGLSSAACFFIQQLPEVAQLLDLVKDDHIDKLLKLIESGKIVFVLAHPILINLLKTVRIPSMELENLFTKIRRLVLFLFVHNNVGDEAKAQLFSFLSSLAYQCYLNEYVYFQEEDEVLWLGTFIEQIEKRLTIGQGLVGSDIALLAGYYPLYLLKSEKILTELSNKNQVPECRGLLLLQMEEPRRELALADQIPTLSDINNETSIIVRDQYEKNPYPRWVDSKYIHSLGGLGAHISALFPHLPFDYISNPPCPDILIAGCGTGKQAIECARTFPEARLLAIDLSRASIAYAMRKAEEMGIGNVEFMQADILEVDQLQRSFDVVASVGVLHHLKDPLEGWRKLLGLVRPGGYMQIGLYSMIARQGLNLAREEIETSDLGSSVEAIRQFRQNLYRRDDGHVLDNLFKLLDFYSVSECRDLLFHVQEHQFTLGQIRENLRVLGLIFLGFEINPSVTACFKRMFPDDAAINDLMKWEEFEKVNPETFISMYQFWVRKPL